LRWSFVYLAVRSLLAFVVLLGRSGRSKELEILGVLRHELRHRRVDREGTRPEDRDDDHVAVESRLRYASRPLACHR
jgi:hypothetical protein